jgi:ribosomal protein S18 acetylase RimI-like enzyme
MSNCMGDRGSDLSFTRVERYSSGRFREAMQIYQAEFPIRSRLPITRIRQLLSTGSYQLFVARDSGRVLGLALVWVCARPAFAHLDYIAVAQQWKGRGIGTAFYRWLIAHLKELSSRAQLLTLEVDDELIDFYRRSQTRVLHQVPYLFPGPRGAVPMHLMVYDCRGRETLDRAVVQGLIRALYRGIHNRGSDDALLRSFISGVPHPVSLV